MLIRGGVHGSKLRGCTSLYYFEHANKSRQARKAGVQCHIGNGHLWINQELLGGGDSLLVQVFVKGAIRKLLEKSGEMKFAKACHICHHIQR